MENPFKDQPGADTGQSPLTSPTSKPQTNRVGQVRTVAVLMILQGSLEAVCGILSSFIGIVFPFMIPFMKMDSNLSAEDVEAFDKMSGFVMAFYLGIGIIVLVLGALRIFAGLRNYQLRGRVLGMVVNVVGLVTIVNGLCLPTAIGLVIYCLIVYLSPDVVRAFEMRNNGVEPNQILGVR
jgi:hypothetical protein